LHQFSQASGFGGELRVELGKDFGPGVIGSRDEIIAPDDELCFSIVSHEAGPQLLGMLIDVQSESASKRNPDHVGSQPQGKVQVEGELKRSQQRMVLVACHEWIARQPGRQNVALQ